MQDKTYNGWTNYATWRVNLEMFDGIDPYEQQWIEHDADALNADALNLAQFLKDYAEECMSANGDGLTLDYALAFLSDVDWHEIAEHMVADYCEEGAA